MKMNDKKQDQIIRGIYRNTQAPDIVKNRTKETLKFLQQQENAEYSVQRKRRRRRKPLTFKRAAVLAAAAILCIGGTVFAAERIYQMQLKREKEYQASLQISSEEELPKEVSEVSLEVNYIPEGFVLDPKKWDHYYINPEEKDVGYYIDEPILADQADPLTVSYVKDAQSLTINGHDAIYINNAYGSGSDPDWKNETIFILYEDVNRILSVNSWGHADKNELIKIAENISLTPTGNMVTTDGISRWSEFIGYMNESEEKRDETVEDDFYFTETSKSQMANTHQIGKKFKIRSFLDNENLTDLQLEATVTDIQTADDFSLLTEKDRIPDYMNELIGGDGKLICDTLNYIKDGDGVDTLPEIVRTQETALKLLYATVEFKNPSTETIHDAWYMVSLMPVVRDGDTYKIFNRADNTCDYVENEHVGVKYEMSYMDVSGGSKNNNYIPEIKPGESVTVHLAWVVNEDELDTLYLDFTGEGLFTEEGLKTGYVNIGAKDS